MITVETREQIRRAYFHEDKTIRQIARELRCSRKTVRKAIQSAEPEAYTLKAPRLAPVLGPYKPLIDQLLAENQRMPPKQRYTGHKIFQVLQAAGYPGSEPSVRGYITRSRQEQQRRPVYLPLEFDPGADAQVDWGEGVAILAEEQVTVQLFVMRLCYSRRTFVMAFPSQRQEAFFEGHVRAFQHVQGVPRRITYDNLKAAVQRILAGHSRQEQQAFIVFRSHYLFESYFCTPGEGHEKGGVEHSVGFDRRNFLVPIPHVPSFEALNAHLRAQCLADDQRQVTGQPSTIGEAWRREQPCLRPLPERDFACCVTRPATLTPYSQVVFETNRYSVPAEQAYRQLVMKAYPFRLEILHLEQVIASHPRCYAREQDIFDPLHYLPLLEQRPGAFDHAKPIRRWREGWPPIYEQLLARLRADGRDGQGVREFVRILRLHREHPAEQVEQAIELALGYGCLQADGVALCLHQLQHPTPPVSSLDLTAQPRLAPVGTQPVDVGRYDQLLTGR
ncbi:MAG: IS21 family transposase [Candidatus Entotheonellia bacterium]